MPEQTTLPPESAATLNYIERESADVIAETETVLGLTLPPDARARLIDYCFFLDTAKNARALRASVSHSLN